MNGAASIRPADQSDLADLAMLFDCYRQFYGQDSDVEGARTFLRERLEREDSVIFVADRDGSLTGFTQLYFSFSSARMARIFILNDLFVAVHARQAGVGSALLKRAVAFAKERGAVRVTLSTQIDNRTAQSAYESNGWVRDSAFLVYNFQLNG